MDSSKFNLPFWYPLFKQFAFKSKFTAVPLELIEFLKTDSLVINSEVVEKLPENLICFIKDTLKEYDSVFVKSNKGATDCDSLLLDREASSVEEVLLALKGSTRVTQDILENGTSTPLVLKKWYSLKPGRLFRLHFYKNKLCQVEQRLKDEFFNFTSEYLVSLQEDANKFEIQLKDSLVVFETDRVALDVYHDINGKFKILDIGPSALEGSPEPLSVVKNQTELSQQTNKVLENAVPEEFREYGSIQDIIAMLKKN